MIIGAGLAGAATAFQLARRGLRDVVVLEQESAPGHHSSGRNAAMVRQVVADGAIAGLAREGARFIAEAAREWAAPGLFEHRGSLLLAGRRGSAGLLQAREAARRSDLDVEVWERDRVEARVEATRGGAFEVGVFTPSDGTVDVHALLQAYLRESRRGGAEVIASRRVDEIIVEGNGRRRVVAVRAGDLEIRTPRVVDAAGAWASEVAALAGAAPIALTPHVRHLVHTGPEPRARRDWPYVWDIDEDVYFRPESDGLLVSPCDHTPSQPGDARSSSGALELLAAKLERAFPELHDVRVGRYWAGHRTFARDERFVIGPDPAVGGFFWVAGLGGHGMTVSAAAGRLAAELIIDPEKDRENPFSPRRLVD